VDSREQVSPSHPVIRLPNNLLNYPLPLLPYPSPPSKILPVPPQRPLIPIPSHPPTPNPPPPTSPLISGNSSTTNPRARTRQPPRTRKEEARAHSNYPHMNIVAAIAKLLIQFKYAPMLSPLTRMEKGRSRRLGIQK